MLAQSWNAFQPLPAFYCVPGVAIALVAGLMLDQPGGALLAAAGAFSAGFGAFQRLTRFSAAPMLLATLAITVFTAIGTATSGSPLLDAAVVGAAAFTLGLAASFGTGPWWVLLQGAIFLIIAGSNPGDWREGASRAVVVLMGGVGQTVLMTLLRRIAPEGFPAIIGPPNAVAPPATRTAWLTEARKVLSPQAAEFRFAITLGIATGAAILIARYLALPNGYWAALTVLLVLRRGGAETLTLSIQRIGGTAVGAAAATLLATLLRPESEALPVLIGTAAWFAYATQWVNFGTFSASITSFVVFLMALIGLPEASTAGHRVVATLLGGAIGFATLALARAGRQASARLWRPR